MATTLLVIDMQQSLLDEGPWHLDVLFGNINSLIRYARDAEVSVIFIRDTRVEPHSELAADLDRRCDDPIISKDFSDSFLNTSLHAQLQKADIRNLVVCGMQTDYCIDTTCRRAASLGYSVQHVSDAHSTFDHEHLPAAKIIAHHNRILRNFPAGGGRVTVVPSAEVGFA
jgi:nicotinamidase-related amidase